MKVKMKINLLNFFKILFMITGEKAKISYLPLNINQLKLNLRINIYKKKIAKIFKKYDN
jgi:hypothetical protein